ncbi:ABC transporter permease subunit [Salinispora mooreana]|uniref:ABC transporter permease subunit n=1 Tax=Salinispora mooreana TaxID=999545 RepID=UPI00035FEBD0|nr:ABC transporter permease subunit [Salinispora mooreana]
MSLYRAELRRLVLRRLTRWATVLGLAVLATVAVGVFLSNQKIDDAARARAEVAAEQDWQQQVRQSEEIRAECEQAAARGDQSGRFPRDCSGISPPPRDIFPAEQYLPATFDFRASFGGTLIAPAAILALVGFVVGSSFVGAEWNTGGMMTMLLWRPKRVTVLLTKLAALLAGLLALAVTTTVLWFGGFWLIATTRGSTEGMTAGAWQSFALTSLRGVVLVLVAAVLGFGLASLGRHTAMALGGAVGVVVVGQFGLGVLLKLTGAKFVEAWLLPTYVQAWLQKEVVLRNWQSCQVNPFGQCEPETLTLTWQHTSGLLAAGLVLILGGACWAIRRRDIS